MRPFKVEPISVRILIVSSACNEPIIPTIGPRIPASEQFATDSGGGALEYKQR